MYVCKPLSHNNQLRTDNNSTLKSFTQIFMVLLSAVEKFTVTLNYDTYLKAKGTHGHSERTVFSGKQ